MSQFEISGNKKLEGEIPVYGAKNAAMKMIAAAVVIKNKVTLENVPDILDIQTIIDILVKDGAKITRHGHTIEIDTSVLGKDDPDTSLVEKMRGSVVLIGPYLARYGKITIPQPGGCSIGNRPIDTHLDAFRQLDVKITETDCGFIFRTNGKIKAGSVTLKEASVTATENILMTTVTAEGQTVINNAACEPEISDLIEFLNKAGAKITGTGTKVIKITGVNQLNKVNHQVIPDRIEAGTFVALAIVTKSPLKIINCHPKHLTAYLDKVKEMGVKLKCGKDSIEIEKIPELKPVNVQTAVYPGFATDLQAPMGLILTQADGKSKLEENLFENRFGYLDQLVKMGARVEFISNREAEITGPTHLVPASVEGLDLRAGATMILAGLVARGKSTILEAEIIDRGYEKIEERLKKVGARIQRVS